MERNIFAVVLACCLVITGAQQNGDLRLRDGPNSDSGRVEIFLSQQWSTLDAGVIYSDWIGPAQTICRQLGYDSVSLSYSGTVSYLGWPAANDSVPMLIQDVSCTYNVLAGSASQHILRCDYRDGPSIPDHQNDFAVSCIQSDDSVFLYDTQVRLRQGHTEYSSSGFVEINLEGSWGPVCNMGSYDADTACRQLGYTQSSHYNSSDSYDSGVYDYKVSSFYCSFSQSCLRDCFNNDDYVSCGNFYSYVNCTFVESNKGLYSTGDQTVCSLRAYIALGIGVGIGVLVLIFLCIIAFSAVCCCCIPGCLIHSSRRKIVYETI